MPKRDDPPLNVQEGDRAIVVRRSSCNPHTHGLLLVVLGREKVHPLLRKLDLPPRWLVRTASGRPMQVNGKLVDVAICPDSALRPLGGDGRGLEEVKAPRLEFA